MVFAKKINARNSAAVIKEVNQMLEAGFPKKETYTVVGAKYNLSYKSVQRIMNGQVLDTTNSHIGQVLDTTNSHIGQVLDTTNSHIGQVVTSADIVDGIMKKYGKKGDDYVDAFNRAPKDADGAIIMKNGSKVYF